MTTPVKEYSLNVIACEDTQRAAPTVLVCVPVHHGPYDLIVKVRMGRYDSKDNRVRSKQLPSAFYDPPTASEWSEDGRTITMYPFKAWDGPVAEDLLVTSGASSRPPDQIGGNTSTHSNGGSPDTNKVEHMGETGSISNKGGYGGKATEASASSLPSDDMDIVPGTPGEDDEAEELWMMRSYRKSVARMRQEVELP